jgi:hypothetical protein
MSGVLCSLSAPGSVSSARNRSASTLNSAEGDGKDPDQDATDSGTDGGDNDYDPALMRVLKRAMAETVAPVVARIEALEKRKSVATRVATPHPVAGTHSAAESLSARSSGTAPASVSASSQRLAPVSALFSASVPGLVAAGSARGGVSVRDFIQHGSAGNDDGADFGDLAAGAEADEGTFVGSSPAATSVPTLHPLFRPLAPEIIEDVGPGGFREWLRAEAPADSWKNARNQHECEVLADVLDELVLRNDTTAAIELLVRRFVGIRQADRSGNWNFAQVLSKGNPRRTLLRPSVMSAVLREAKNLSLLESGGRANNSGRSNNSGAAANRAGSKSGAQAAQSGRGGGNNRRRGGNNSNNSSNAAPSQAARGAGSASAARAAGSEHDE